MASLTTHETCSIIHSAVNKKLDDAKDNVISSSGAASSSPLDLFEELLAPDFTLEIAGQSSVSTSGQKLPIGHVKDNVLGPMFESLNLTSTKILWIIGGHGDAWIAIELESEGISKAGKSYNHCSIEFVADTGCFQLNR